MLVVHPFAVASPFQEVKLARLPRQREETLRLLGLVEIVLSTVGEEEWSRRDPAHEVLDRKPQKQFARVIRHGKPESGVFVELRLDVLAGQSLERDEIERGKQSRAPMLQPLAAVLVEAIGQSSPRCLVVESPRRPIAAGAAVHVDDARPTWVVCGLRDDERPTEPPPQENDSRLSALEPTAREIDRCPNVFDLLGRNESSPLAIAEAEAAVI